MNENAFENKVNHDVDQTKKDLATLGDDGVTGLRRVMEPLAENARNKFAAATKVINKEVGHGLSQYNEKVQDIANRVPGSFGKKAAGYPWVTITISLALGLLLGVILKPGRQAVG
jgi:ElaB/YqjD/DUF883 family membrane-anchored ribosome-binding protein